MNDLKEVSFDINNILVELFTSLESIIKEKNIDILYEVDAHIPKELRGDTTALLRLLVGILTFVLENTNKKEILLKLSAPEDFLYEEEISFSI